MSDFEQLKPCPFCGGEVKLEQTINHTGWGVVCRNSLNLGGTCAIEQIPSKEKQAAITRWNTRSAIASMQGEAVGVVTLADDISQPDTSGEHKGKYQNMIYSHAPLQVGAHVFTYPPSASAEIARLQKELEEARKDAERYRMMRSLDVTPYEKWNKAQKELHRAMNSADTVEMVDTAIDAAIRQIGGGE